MSVYAIADLDVKDRNSPELKRYAEEVPKTIEKYGGRYLVRGGKFEVLEGGWKPKLMVVLEFPTMEALKRWYNSEEYRPLLALRQKAASTDAVVVEGV